MNLSRYHREKFARRGRTLHKERELQLRQAADVQRERELQQARRATAAAREPEARARVEAGFGTRRSVAAAVSAARPAEEIMLWSSSARPVSHIAIADCEGHASKPNPLEALTEAEFVETMRRYRMWAGNPSFRKMQEACGNAYTYGAFCRMLKASSIPKRLDMVDAFVRSLNGTEEDRRQWASAWRHFTVLPSTSSGQPALAAEEEGTLLRLTGS